MTTRKAVAVEQLGNLCAAGQDRINRFGSLDPGYLDGVVLPELDTVMEQASVEIEERHLTTPETEDATLRVTHTRVWRPPLLCCELSPMDKALHCGCTILHIAMIPTKGPLWCAS